ncbi:hypothetical protein SJ05684_c31840 [Sinorhizobium sojae CCBAU 05684]|uniref:Uncharacterized protein n=1 Tax=Sinorhizobium sojae CCBAU 05684 TaxID=716928 RepID=A0A249PFW3_9HYPH|nr:hypothetical protein SJ05684_c31840 [Sinorhizobium sojae CCBAU 05684]
MHPLPPCAKKRKRILARTLHQNAPIGNRPANCNTGFQPA